MHEHARESFDDPSPTLEGLLPRPESLVFLADPTHQVGVDARQQRVECRAVERAIVLHPTADDRIDAPRQLDEGKAGTIVQSPGPHFRTDSFSGHPC